MLHQLPQIILKDILDYVSPYELLEVKISCKSVYSIVDLTVKYHLKHCTYFQKECNTYQDDYIKNNPLLMKRLVFDNSKEKDYVNYDQINQFINIEVLSIHYKSERELNELNKLDPSCLSKLKGFRFIGEMPFSNQGLKLPIHKSKLNFNILFNVELLDIKVKAINSRDFNCLVKYLNPIKLKELRLFGYDILNISDLDYLRIHFKNLVSLYIKTWALVYVPSNIKATDFEKLTIFSLEAQSVCTSLSLADFFEELINVPNIKELNIKIEDRRYQDIFNINPLKAKLDSLVLFNVNLIQPKKYINISHLTKVTVLMGNGNYTSILKSIYILENILELKLMDCKIGFQNNTIIAPPENSKIEIIHFVDCEIVINQIFEFLKCIKKLKSVHYQGKLIPGKNTNWDKLSVNTPVLFWLESNDGTFKDTTSYDKLKHLNNLVLLEHKK